MKRHVDWRGRLATSIEEQRRRPYNPGEFDCALFAANCVEAMTGVDLAADFRGRYTTIPGAVKALRRAGYKDLADLAAKHLEEISAPLATTGDIAVILTDDDLGWNAGVVNGERVFVLRLDGVGTIARHDVARAFRVP